MPNMAALSYCGTPSQNLTLPQSQNTAPVLEYRCLFTHDIFKKQKKWHDGSLRFHTFNRRVMVYDDSKNLVGDLHYRQAEDFVEGLEFQLDKPVKVVVEEQLGQSRTDLTPLLGKQKQDTTVHDVASTSRVQASRPMTSALQGKPKSIKELLGVSQGHLGRAMLPQRSPFEQRQSLLGTNQEPSAKRQKLTSGKENVTPAPTRETLSTRHSAPINMRKASHNAHTGSMVDSSEVVDLSSMDRTPVSTSAVDPSATRNRARQSAVKRALQDPNAINSILGLSREPLRQEKSVKERKRQSKRTVNADNLVENRVVSTSPLTSLAQNTSKANRPNRPAPSGPRSSLSFMKQNPRRKLVYKALLPGNTNSELTSGPIRGVQPLSPSQHLPNATEGLERDCLRKNTTLDIDEIFGDFEEEEQLLTQHHLPRKISPEVVHANVSMTEQVTGGSDARHGLLHTFEGEKTCLTIDSSPLFMPKTVSQMSQVSAQIIDKDDFCVPSQIRNPLDLLPPQTPAPESDTASEIEDSFSRRTFANEPLDDEEQTFPELPSITKAAEHPLQDLISDHEEAPCHISAAVSIPNLQTTEIVRPNLSAQRHNTIRRVQSENNAETSLDSINPDEITSNLDIVGEASHHSRPRLSQVNQLQRTTSDPSAIASGVVQCQPRTALETTSDTAEDTGGLCTDSAHSEETGPWTTTEAFLLFDRWPEAKRNNKPDFGQIEAGTSCHPLEPHYQSKLAGMETRKYAVFASAKFVSQR